MSLLVAIEGADGAGKATAAANVSELLIAGGISARVISFPRYRETAGGVFLGEFLSGRTPVPVTAKAAAVLYALDRLESVEFVAQASAVNEVLVFDRYIASNMVYQASKVGPGKQPISCVGFSVETECSMCFRRIFDYLDTALDAARKLMQLKSARSYTDRQYDELRRTLAFRRPSAAIIPRWLAPVSQVHGKSCKRPSARTYANQPTSPQKLSITFWQGCGTSPHPRAIGPPHQMHKPSGLVTGKAV